MNSNEQIVADAERRQEIDELRGLIDNCAILFYETNFILEGRVRTWESIYLNFDLDAPRQAPGALS